MDLQQLYVFRSAALNGCFTKASEELHVSQSTVSLHVKNLEDNLGCPLFFRTGRHVVLSPAGKLLLEHAEKILEAAQAAERAVRELNNLQCGPIRCRDAPPRPGSAGPNTTDPGAGTVAARPLGSFPQTWGRGSTGYDCSGPRRPLRRTSCTAWMPLARESSILPRSSQSLSAISMHRRVTKSR